MEEHRYILRKEVEWIFFSNKEKTLKLKSIKRGVRMCIDERIRQRQMGETVIVGPEVANDCKRDDRFSLYVL